MKISARFLEEARQRCSPDAECPALLFGREETVLTWSWLRNVLNSPTAFLLDPEEMYGAITDAEASGLDLVAIFHTHPGPPAPSPLDLKYMRLWPVAWVISNVYTWETAAWRFKEGRAVPVHLEWI
ncbi:MAG: M67 family metallopeptidase [Pyrobaculum sp.]|nr:M67 family metallopeptidase [Pyrobaculum sp.]